MATAVLKRVLRFGRHVALRVECVGLAALRLDGSERAPHEPANEALSIRRLRIDRKRAAGARVLERSINSVVWRQMRRHDLTPGSRLWLAGLPNSKTPRSFATTPADRTVRVSTVCNWQSSKRFLIVLLRRHCTLAQTLVALISNHPYIEPAFPLTLRV